MVQLSERYHISVSTVLRKLRSVHSTRIISKDKDVVVLMDACYWGASFGVLVFKDAYRGKVLCRTDRESFEGAWGEWHSRWGEYIKERSVDGGTGRRFYTHKSVRNAYFSIKRNIHYRGTCCDRPEADLPYTNNGIEALFTDLKSKLRVHNGLSKRARKVFIDEYFRQKNYPIA